MTRTLLLFFSSLCILLVCAGCASDPGASAVVAATQPASTNSPTIQPTKVAATNSATALPYEKTQGSGPATPLTEASPRPSEPLSAIIGDLLAHPAKNDGQPVEVIGYFRGWDMLGEVTHSTPVTRSDWVITDASGSMYVTGMLPANLDPASKDDVWVELHLKATFVDTGKAYLKAESVEIIP